MPGLFQFSEPEFTKISPNLLNLNVEENGKEILMNPNHFVLLENTHFIFHGWPSNNLEENGYKMRDMFQSEKERIRRGIDDMTW